MTPTTGAVKSEEGLVHQGHNLSDATTVLADSSTVTHGAQRCRDLLSPAPLALMGAQPLP